MMRSPIADLFDAGERLVASMGPDWFHLRGEGPGHRVGEGPADCDSCEAYRHWKRARRGTAADMTADLFARFPKAGWWKRLRCRLFGHRDEQRPGVAYLVPYTGQNIADPDAFDEAFRVAHSAVVCSRCGRFCIPTPAIMPSDAPVAVRFVYEHRPSPDVEEDCDVRIALGPSDWTLSSLGTSRCCPDACERCGMHCNGTCARSGAE